MMQNYQPITCHYCFEMFEIDIEVESKFSGHNVEIFDCEICCNPNKVDTEVMEGVIISLEVSDGNE